MGKGEKLVLTDDQWSECLRRGLVSLASLVEGIKEEGGNNRGQMVERFQKAVDGKAWGEPWCAAFVFWAIKENERYLSEVLDQPLPFNHGLFESEHVLTCWNKSPIENRLFNPEPGCLMVWQSFKNGKATTSGHIGIVTKILNDSTVQTIEGNTSDEGGLQRDGDGVYSKYRIWHHDAGRLRFKGWLRVW